VLTETRAAEIISEYQHVISRAAARTWTQYRAFLAAVPVSARPFEREDIDQWAREGILILAGYLPGSNHGQLQQRAAQGERFIQHSVNLCVAERAQREVRKFRSVTRGEGEIPAYLDTPIMEDSTLADVAFAGEYGTNERAMPDVAKRYPVLWMMDVQGLSDARVATLLGLTLPELQERRMSELESFHVWATRNRRVKAGTGLPDKPYRTPVLRGCPYEDPACTGQHRGSLPKSRMCPSAYAAKLQKNRDSKARAAA